MNLAEKRFYLLIAVFFLIGLIITILSYIGACTTACAEVHFYKYFGFNFEILGLIFFVVAGTLHILTYWFPRLGYIVGLLLAGAVGSEADFILVQKYVIGQWCPLCLTIAVVVGILSLLYLTLFFYRFFYVNKPMTWGKFMKALSKGLSVIFVCLVAYGVAFVGVFKPDKSYAGSDVPYFGDAESPVEVYIITDWFCPACRRTQPKISPYYNRIMAKARLYFIDYPIHPESMNYVPYNLSFMINNKKDYLKLRKALDRLSQKTKTPTTADVNKAIKIYGVAYSPLNYADINEGVKFNEGIVKSFKVNQTPTVVVANRKQLKAKKLTGSDITGQNIIKAIEAVKEN